MGVKEIVFPSLGHRYRFARQEGELKISGKAVTLTKNQYKDVDGVGSSKKDEDSSHSGRYQ